MRSLVTAMALAATLSAHAAAPGPIVNSIGMEFVPIPAGSFTYGRFQPPSPLAPAAPGALGLEQQAAVTAMNDQLAPVEQAATAARAALLGGSLEAIPATALSARAAALGTAELALAQARAEGFAALQRTPARLDVAQVATLAQQAAAGPTAGRGGRGGQMSLEDARLADAIIRRDTRPGFAVQIPRAFYLGKFEVTQEQWKKVMGTNPSTFQGDKVSDAADKHPVETVTWEDAQTFIRKLNELEKTDVYRLPTEFEWEYAGKAGASDDPTWNEIRAMAVIQNSRGGTTLAVGTKLANPWGLHDMLGNVWEWTQDFYNERLFNDPTPPGSGSTHVLKGGGFLADVKNAIYSTHGGGPGDKWSVGFRVLREAR
jgi:sulfatase modifying factor 1